MSDTVEFIAVVLLLILAVLIAVGMPLFVLYLVVKIIKYAWLGVW